MCREHYLLSACHVSDFTRCMKRWWCTSACESQWLLLFLVFLLILKVNHILKVPPPLANLKSSTEVGEQWLQEFCRSCAFVPAYCTVWCWGSADTRGRAHFWQPEVRANNHGMLLSDFLHWTVRKSGGALQHLFIYFSTHNTVDKPTVLQCVSVECLPQGLGLGSNVFRYCLSVLNISLIS